MHKIKRKGLAVLLTAFCLLFGVPVLANDTDTLINRQLEVLDLDALDKQASQSLADSGSTEQDFSFIDFVKKLLTGKLDLSVSGLAQKLLDLLLGQLKNQTGLLRNLLLIVLLSAVLKSLNDNFSAKGVGELGFTVCYVVLILLVMAAFSNGAALVRDATESMEGLLSGMLPIFTLLSASSGNYTYAVAAGPLILGGAQLLVTVIRYVLLPFLTLSTVLALTNHLSEHKLLDQFTKLAQGIITWGLRVIAGTFMLLLSLLRVGSPAMNQLLGRTAKTVVGSVPVVGQLMTGAVETASALAGMVQNGLAVGLVVTLLLVSLAPLLRLAAMILMYKLTAALVEPVAEGRLVKALSAAGDFSKLLLGALFAADVMFLFAVLTMTVLL